MTENFRSLLMPALLIAVLAGCGDRKLPTEPDGGLPPPSPDATFTRVQLEVFTPNCALAGCHAGAAPQQGMSLEAGQAYDNIVLVTATERPSLYRINPGQPDASYLVKKIRGDPDISGSPMPLSGSISGQQRQLVVDWVRRGAPMD